MTDYIKINPTDKFKISGRGVVYTFKLEEDSNRGDIHKKYMNQTIEINGKLYTVIGIDMFCIERQRKGISVGLLVKDYKGE